MATMWREDTIRLEGAPAIHGLRFRRFQGEADYPGMLAVLNAHNAADRIEERGTLEELANNYRHLTNCEPYQDMILAEVDGRLIAYNRVSWATETEGDWIYTHFGFLMPEWRRKGIGTAMFHAAEARLREIAASHTQNEPRFYQSFAGDTAPGAEALLKREGYASVRHGYLMMRPDLENIPDAALPEGIEVRPVRPEHMRAIWDAMQEAFRDHWGHRPTTDEDFERWRHDPVQDPVLWRVAWDGDQVAGMVLSFINETENESYRRLRGYTEDISVRRPWRRRGLARALILLSLEALKDRGMAEAALGVDTENRSGALRLYESVGYRPVKRFTTYRKELVL